MAKKKRRTKKDRRTGRIPLGSTVFWVRLSSADYSRYFPRLIHFSRR
ncbi:hypothetical protein [Paenibacillus chondroitinus]|nr:hypothetical protein [Paenibacillus chondroitinus]